MALSFSDIETQVAAVTRIQLSEGTNQSLIDRAINDTIQDIHGRRDWFWTIDRETMQTVIDKTAGTVSIDSNSQTVSGSSTSFLAADVGKYIQFSSSNDWYKITAVSSTTSLTIEVPYTNTANLSAGTYTIRQFYYSLSSNAEKVIDFRQVIGPTKLTMVTAREFDGLRAHPTATGTGDSYFVWGIDSSNNLTFFVYPFASEVYNLEVRIKKKATESDVSSIPAKWRHVVLDGSIYRSMRFMNPNESTLESIRVQRTIYEDGIAKMIEDAEPESDYHPVISNNDVEIRIGDVVRFPSAFGSR